MNMNDTYYNGVKLSPYNRIWTCFECGHKWKTQVVLSDNAISLSGEKKEWCPKCNSGNVWGEPAKELNNH